MTDTTEKKENHFVKQARLKREAAEAAAKAAESMTGGTTTGLPPDPADVGTGDDSIPGPDVLIKKDAPTEKQIEDHVFGKETVQRATAPGDNMMLVDRDMLAQMMRDINELKGKDGAIDLGAIKKQKRIIRVPIWSDYETNEDYIIVDLEERVERDGSRTTTWSRGLEESQITGLKGVVTWIKPVMVNLKTLIKESKEIRYDEFSSMVRVVPLEVVKEHSVEVDMTPVAGKNEVREQVSYEEVGQFYKKTGTGIMVKLQVWGIKTTFTVEYEGNQYDIEQSVVNYK